MRKYRSRLAGLLPELPYAEIGSRVGSGSFSSVYNSQAKAGDENQRRMVIKVFRKDEDNVNDDYYPAVRELAVLRKMSPATDRANIGLRSILRGGSFFLALVMPSWGVDLKKYIEKNTVTTDFFNRILWFSVAALKSLKAISHDHLDLKPENLVVDDRGVIKMIDFGAALPKTQSAKWPPDRGTPPYLLGYYCMKQGNNLFYSAEEKKQEEALKDTFSQHASDIWDQYAMLVILSSVYGQICDSKLENDSVINSIINLTSNLTRLIVNVAEEGSANVSAMIAALVANPSELVIDWIGQTSFYEIIIDYYAAEIENDLSCLRLNPVAVEDIRYMLQQYFDKVSLSSSCFRECFPVSCFNSEDNDYDYLRDRFYLLSGCMYTMLNMKLQYNISTLRYSADIPEQEKLIYARDNIYNSMAGMKGMSLNADLSLYFKALETCADFLRGLQLEPLGFPFLVAEIMKTVEYLSGIVDCKLDSCCLPGMF